MIMYSGGITALVSILMIVNCYTHSTRMSLCIHTLYIQITTEGSVMLDTHRTCMHACIYVCMLVCIQTRLYVHMYKEHTATTCRHTVLSTLVLVHLYYTNTLSTHACTQYTHSSTVRDTCLKGYVIGSFLVVFHEFVQNFSQVLVSRAIMVSEDDR